MGDRFLLLFIIITRPATGLGRLKLYHLFPSYDVSLSNRKRRGMKLIKKAREKGILEFQKTYCALTDRVEAEVVVYSIQLYIVIRENVSPFTAVDVVVVNRTAHAPITTRRDLESKINAGSLEIVDYPFSSGAADFNVIVLHLYAL